jgi:serine/threonine protein kinase
MSANVNNFCNNLTKLGEYTGLTNPQLIQIGTYIENTLPAQVAVGRVYLKKRLTGLPRTIEYDPATRLTFIHLKTHGGVQLVGQGGFKKVTKSIIYDPKAPKIVANCATKIDDLQEAKFAIKVNKSKGLAGAKAATVHRKADGTHRLNIFMKLYKPGSLQSIFDRKVPLTLKEKAKIAYDTVCGLTALHKKDTIHRDLKPGNILVDFIDRSHEGKARKVRAVVSDFGLLYDKSKQKGALDFTHGTPFYSPPVCLTPKSLQRKDFKVVDVYPLGVTFYNLLHDGQNPAWLAGNNFVKLQQDVQQKLLVGKSAEVVKKEVDSKISTALSGRMEALKKIKHKTPSEQFESLTLKMLAPKTQKEMGHSLDDVKKKLETIYKKL